MSEAQQELVVLDEYEQHLIKLWREVGSVSQGGMGVAPLAWEEIIKWADKFYLADTIVMVPKTITKSSEKLVKDWWKWKTVREIETIVEETPVVVKRSILKDYELEIIMQLSREYCNEYSEAVDPLRDCPREIFLDEVDAIANADAILEGFKSLWGGAQNMAPEIVPR